MLRRLHLEIYIHTFSIFCTNKNHLCFAVVSCEDPEQDIPQAAVDSDADTDHDERIRKFVL